MLYTHGLTEAVSGREGKFGEERLLQVLRDRLVDQVTKFSGGEPEDDMTILVMAVSRGEASMDGSADAHLLGSGCIRSD